MSLFSRNEYEHLHKPWRLKEEKYIRIAAKLPRRRGVSASQVAEAVARFIDNGGIILRLPDGPTPMRFLAEGDAAKYNGFFTLVDVNWIPTDGEMLL